jgi:hypothetical protein
MFVKKLARATAFAALSVVLLASPSLAKTTYFGSGDGTSYVSSYTQYGNGFKASGKIKPYSSSHKLYWSGRIDNPWWYGDTYCGRFTSDVTGTTSYTYRSGTCAVFQASLATNGKAKLCKNQFGPDPCGSWSANLR